MAEAEVAYSAEVPVGGTDEFVLLRDGSFVEVPEGMVLVNANQPGQAPFFMSRYEVTNAEYLSYLQASGVSRYPAGWAGGMYPAGTAAYPVIGVSSVDALAYGVWVAAGTGRAITLPSAGQVLEASRGARVSLPLSRTDSFIRPVGSDPADCSIYGCYDLIGNAREWTLEGASTARTTNQGLGFRLVCNDPLAAGSEATLPASAIDAPPPTLVDPPTVGAPTITTQPASQSVTPGSNVTFAVAATAANGTLTYQWYFNGATVNGATAATLTLAAVQVAAAGSYSVIVTSSVQVTDDVGTVHTISASIPSNAATLTVAAGQAPQITQQPLSQTVAGGTSPVFSSTASGTQPLTFKWTTEVQGSGGPMLVPPPNAVQITNTADTSLLTVGDASYFPGAKISLTVTNAYGSVTSAVATLTVVEGGVAPTITTQPAAQTVALGGTATFRVEAGGFPAPTYQWSLNGTVLAGATNATLGVASAQMSNAGNYTVTVSNAMGNVTSGAAQLTVTGASTTPPAGGGGGAPSLWFCVMLGALAGWRRWMARSCGGRSEQASR